MQSLMIFCDFSKQFTEQFRAALDLAETSQSLINVIHVVNLSSHVHESGLPANSRERSLLQFLRVQAQKEFSLINKRLNRTDIPVTFEVTFRSSMISVL